MTCSTGSLFQTPHKNARLLQRHIRCSQIYFKYITYEYKYKYMYSWSKYEYKYEYSALEYEYK